MSFPMEVSRVSLDHQGGTKSYHTTFVTTIDGRSLLIKRFGKTSAFGTLKVEDYPTIAKGEKALESIIREKTRKGYREVSADTKTANDQDELMKAVGRPTWAGLGAKAILHLLPNASTNGVRDPEPPEYDEDGNYLGKRQPRKFVVTEDMKALAEAEAKAEKAAAYAHNPKWGMF